MADIELLRPVHLAEGTAEWRIVEERIVSKTALAAALAKDFAFDFAAKHAARLPGFSQRDRTDEPARAMRVIAQSLQQQTIVGFIVRSGTGVARRMHPGLTRQGIHFESGIVGEERPGCELAVIFRLQPRIRFEGVASL